MQMGLDAFHAPGHRIFPKLFFADHQKFIYPPASLFLIEAMDFAPRLHVSPDTARRALLLASWLGTLTAAVWFYREQRGSIMTLEAASIVLLAVLFLPIAEAFYRGQAQLGLTFLWGLSAIQWGAAAAAGPDSSSQSRARSSPSSPCFCYGERCASSGASPPSLPRRLRSSAAARWPTSACRTTSITSLS